MRAPRAGCSFEKPAAFASGKMRFGIRRDALVGHHLDALRDLPAIKQSGGSASVTIRIERLIEPIVDEIVCEGLLTMLAISDVVFTRHMLQMLGELSQPARVVSTPATIPIPHSVSSAKSVA